MPVNVQGSRPLATTFAALPTEIVAEAPLENDTDNTIRFRVSRNNLTPPAFSKSVTTTSGSPTIAAADLSKLRVGDAIAHSNITGNVTAVNLAASPNTATVSANASASGTVSVTVTPVTFDLALYDVVATHVMNAGDSNLYVTLSVHAFDGTGAVDANADGKDDVAASGTNKVTQFNLTIALDSILTNVRVPRA